MCAVPVLFLLAAAYCLLKVYRRNVKFDDEGFTLHRVLFVPVRVAWVDVRSVGVSDAEEQHLVIGKERGSAKISLHMNGLGRFADYLEHFAPVKIPPEVWAMIPRLEPGAEQTLPSSAR